ncbi:MAG: phosphomannomutase/phosphoglucomutase [Atribacterota bacterium]
MSIFKDCDIRGIYQEEITDEKAYLIGRACASMVPEGSRFAVGGDVRKSTPKLKSHLVKGLLESGVHVIDIGTVPTPLLYFAVDKLHIRGGIMVTASHNPAQYNGFKVILGDIPVTPEDIREIEHRVSVKDFRNGFGNLSQVENLEKDYFSFLRSISQPPVHSLQVVVDCGNGCFAGLAPHFLHSMGYQTTPVFCERDGSFPNRPPNPSQPENLTALSSTILHMEADVGIAFDGDGDRVVFADEKGRVLLPEQGIIFFLREIMPALPPQQKFVYDVKCSRIVPQEITRLGGIPLMERSGHTYIKTRLLREDAFMAGEISGHYFFRELRRDDGLYAALVFLSHLSRQKKSLSQIVSTFPEPNVTPDIRISARGREGLMFILEKNLHGHALSKIDGIRAEWPEGWGLIRNSVTEPVYTLRFEATRHDLLPEIVHRFLGTIPDLEKDVLERINTSIQKE